MNLHVKQYRPAFFEGFVNEEADVDTLEELLALEFVSRWASSPGFSRFSVSSHPYNDKVYHNLMAEINDNMEWWVVAILEGDPLHPIFQALPKWQSPNA